MPNDRNVSYDQDFRPFTPFRVTLGEGDEVRVTRLNTCTDDRCNINTTNPIRSLTTSAHGEPVEPS